MARIPRQVVGLLSALLVGVALFAAPAGAHPGHRGGHLWNVHIKPRLSNEGTINHPSNPVHWTRLHGVPTGFADGTDSVSDGPAEDLDCAGCVQNAEIESVDSSKITGDITATDVACSTTCVQNAEIESVASSKITGDITATDVACSSPCVDGTEIGTGVVMGEAVGSAPDSGHIAEQTVTGGADGNLVLGTITADNLAQGSVGASEIAGGAVTAEDMTATWAFSSDAGPVFLDDGSPDADLLTTNIELTDAAGNNHAVLLNGALFADCAGCTDTISVVAQLLEDGTTPIGPPFFVPLDPSAPTASFPLSFVRSATASDAGTLHTYSIRVETSSSGSDPYTVVVVNAHLSAVDVGRA
ncbi:MAG: hypothetical protein ACRDJP_01285 [Actinomycetota bacterium]